MMEKIDQYELVEILDSYGINGVSYDTSKWVNICMLFAVDELKI